jgi:hypothetical protein
MLTYVPIANTALQHLGESKRISSENEASKAAAAIKAAWEPTRLFVLAEAHWSFAVRTVALALAPPIPIGRSRSAARRFRFPPIS